MKPGTLVRMSETGKAGYRANGCEDHVTEFGECIGVVIGPMEHGYFLPAPDVDVRWRSSGLRYGYHPRELSVIRKGEA